MNKSLKYYLAHLACAFSLTVMATSLHAQTLLAQWKLDDPSSINPTTSLTTPTADFTGNGASAAFRPAPGPGPVAGLTAPHATLGTAFGFDGTTQDLLVTTSPAIANLSSTFTLTAWVYTSAPGTHYILGFSGAFPANNNGVRFGVYSMNTGLVLTLGGVADYELLPPIYTGPNPIPSNVWHHVAVVVAGANADATFYLDGVNVGSIAGGGPAIPRNASYTIGSNPIFGTFGMVNGRLDDIRVYSGLLSPAQITALANPGGAGVNDWSSYD